MFKVLFFCAIFYAASAEIPFSACEQGESYRDNCSSCVCDASGVYICSRSSCYQEKQMQETRFVSARHSRLRRNLVVVEESEQELPTLRFEVGGCTPSEIKNEGCHRCKCVVSGRGWICTTKCIENESDQALTSENLSTSES